MDAILSVVIIGVVFVFDFILNKRKLNFVGLFILEWLMIVFFSALRLDEYYEVENSTYQIIWIGVVSFFFGALAFQACGSRKKRQFSSALRKRDYSKASDYSNKVIMIFLWIHLFTTIYFTIKTVSFLRMGYSYAYMRNIFQGYDTNVLYTGSQLEDVIRNWIALPLQIAIPIIAVCVFIQKQRKIKYFFPLVILDQILYVFYSQNKGAFVNIALYLVILLIQYWRKLRNKTKRRIRAIVILSSFIVVGLFALRNTTGTDSSILNVMYKYICGCVNLLNEKIAYAEKGDMNTYGLSYIYGLITPIESLLGFVGIGKTPFYSYVSEIQLNKEIFIRIGPSRWMNAYCTVFYDFYLDFRIVGVILGGLSFGAIAEYGSRKLRSARITNNTYDLSISLCIAFIVVKSMVRWELASANFAMTIVYFIFMKYISKYIRD